MPTKTITPDDLVKLAQKCTKQSERDDGYPLLDDVAEVLEDVALRILELESENERLREAHKKIRDAVDGVSQLVELNDEVAARAAPRVSATHVARQVRGR